MLGQPFVDERVIRGQQIDDVPVLADDALEQQFRFGPERLTQVIVPIRIEQAIWGGRRQISQIQPLRRSSSPARRNADPPACGAPAVPGPPGRLVCPWGQPISSSSGMVLQRKNDNREANSRSLIR